MQLRKGLTLDRESIMGVKITETSILQGMQVYHNFIKPHEGLDGKTPAEACGIELKGENKWKTLIQNASVQAKAT
jgi:putative transposase